MATALKSPLLAAPLLAGMALSAPAATLGDDGLYKEPWRRETFRDLAEDLAEADAENRRLMILIQQRGCIHCKSVHEEVFSDAAIAP